MMQKLQTTQDWLQHLEQVSPEIEIKLGLERIKEVGESMDVLTPDAFVFTVAGTNGKGSTIAILESIFLAAGYKVGSFTSPHVRSFNERIKINGQWITEEQLYKAFTKVEKFRGDVKLSYFEFVSLAAFYCFDQHDLDIIIIEIGLGGRLDTGNCIDSDVSVITSIGLDHQEFLGNTEDKIAKEKVHIMRKGKPLIYGATDIFPSVLEHSVLLNSEIYCKGIDFSFTRNNNSTWNWVGSGFAGEAISLTNLPLPGSLVLNNAATAIQALHRFRQTISIEDIKIGLRNINIEGRCQQIKINNKDKEIEFILDVAHNVQAVAFFLENINNLKKHGKFNVVFAVFASKDYKQMLQKLLPVTNEFFITAVDSPRALATKKLAKCLTDLHTNFSSYQNVEQAITAAIDKTKPNQKIIVLGTFMLIGNTINILETKYLT